MFRQAVGWGARMVGVTITKLSVPVGSGKAVRIFVFARSAATKQSKPFFIVFWIASLRSQRRLIAYAQISLSRSDLSA